MTGPALDVDMVCSGTEYLGDLLAVSRGLIDSPWRAHWRVDVATGRVYYAPAAA
jgi:hypothetical protein